MQLGQSLELRQTQRLAMTPQLRQALKLLHMNQQDLLIELHKALENNPLLQADEELQSPAAILPAQITPSPRTQDDGPDIDALPAAAATLAEHLVRQIGMSQASAAQIALAQNLARELEPDGYLRTSLPDFAAQSGVALTDVEAALKLVQACEPCGVGARDLRECLSLQLAEQGSLDAANEALLSRLDLVAANAHEALLQLSGLDAGELGAALERIRALNPRPGAAFQDDQAAIVVPEIIVKRDAFGQWICEHNPDALPKISINTAYAKALGGARTKKNQMSKDWMDQANWLLRALTQRAENILKVASAIVEHQARFFEFGVEQMRPLSLREIAEKTALHESTISRTVNAKYLTCRAGTFEMRYFFTAGLAATRGDERFGAVAVRARIKRLIDEENHKNPHSDDDLVKILRGDGVDIARRTVAKYRMAMGISSSVQRRRQYLSAKRIIG